MAGGNTETASRAVAKYIFAGLCASLIGIGLARFAYTPLLPVLIEARWFSASDTVYLGAANLAGYLLGAMLGRTIAARATNVWTLRFMMLLVAASFVACAYPLSLSWFFAWRFLSGVAGGTIMVLVTGTVLPHVPAHHRGLASGGVFLGVGFGIVASGSLVPLLLDYGLRDTWLVLGGISFVLTAVIWFAWPRAQVAPSKTAVTSAAPRIGIVYTEYALMAAGLVPPMVFLADFVARGLGAGPHFGSFFWVLYGIGAMIGPPLYGFMADRLGARLATRILLSVQVFVMSGLAFAENYAAIGALSVMAGTFPPGIVPLVLAWINKKVPDAARQNVIWSRATIVFAAAQAASAYASSAIFNLSGGDHRLLFALGAGTIFVVVLVDFVWPLLARASRD